MEPEEPQLVVGDDLHRPPRLIMPPTPRRRGPGRVSKVSPDIAIGMMSAGVPGTQVARVFGVTQQTLHDLLKRTPEAKDRIAILRERLKDLKMTKAHHMEAKLWTRLEKETDSGEARDVDAIARALLASEKIQAAASGEAHASGSPPPAPPTVDLKMLVNVLLGGS